MKSLGNDKWELQNKEDTITIFDRQQVHLMDVAIEENRRK